MEGKDRGYIAKVVSDVRFLLIITIFFILYGPLTYNIPIIFSLLLMFGAFSLGIGIYTFSLNEDDLHSRAEILRLCSDCDSLNSYTFFKYTMGFGALAYMCYISQAKLLAIFICVYSILNLIGLYLIKLKNDVLFKKFKTRK